jgi:hypothetical protein
MMHLFDKSMVFDLQNSNPIITDSGLGYNENLPQDGAENLCRICLIEEEDPL